MRDKMERLVVLPFTIGCVSHSSVATLATNQQQPKKAKSDQSNSSAVTRREESEDSSSVVEKMKSSWGFLAIPKPGISNGLQRLVKSFKSFSQLFVYKEEMEEEGEMEMEIGLPTDVKHVTHIGWDGTTTTTTATTTNHLPLADQLLSFSSVSLRQFELAMAAQADGPLCSTLG